MKRCSAEEAAAVVRENSVQAEIVEVFGTSRMYR